MRIFTIGYEGTTVAEFIAALKQAGVERVIDVRALPLSRRPGFSKTPCGTRSPKRASNMSTCGRSGTPADGRAAARAGRHEDLSRIYAGQLELPEAIAQAAQMLELAGEKPSALLCFEREPAHATAPCCSSRPCPTPRSSTSTPDRDAAYGFRSGIDEMPVALPRRRRRACRLGATVRP